MKQRIILILGLILSTIWLNNASACEACQKQQPKITQGITHGLGPESQFDWVIVSFIALLTIYTLIASIKYLVNPGEKKSSHIKYSILD